MRQGVPHITVYNKRQLDYTTKTSHNHLVCICLQSPSNQMNVLIRKLLVLVLLAGYGMTIIGYSQGIACMMMKGGHG